MDAVVKCPACGAVGFDLSSYESMMVLTSDYALFTLRCPHCNTKVSNVCAIPPKLRYDVEAAASKLHCGMGREASSL